MGTLPGLGAPQDRSMAAGRTSGVSVDAIVCPVMSRNIPGGGDSEVERIEGPLQPTLWQLWRDHTSRMLVQSRAGIRVGTRDLLVGESRSLYSNLRHPNPRHGRIYPKHQDSTDHPNVCSTRVGDRRRSVTPLRACHASDRAATGASLPVHRHLHLWQSDFTCC
jgi:hypothetical protein